MFFARVIILYLFPFLAEIDEYYADVRYERIAILNALGAYYTYLGKIETKQREKEEHFILATQYYNKASRIDMHEPSTWVGKGESCWDSLCYHICLSKAELACYFKLIDFSFGRWNFC